MTEASDSRDFQLLLFTDCAVRTPLYQLKFVQVLNTIGVRLCR